MVARCITQTIPRGGPAPCVPPARLLYGDPGRAAGGAGAAELRPPLPSRHHPLGRGGGRRPAGAAARAGTDKVGLGIAAYK